MINEPGVYVTTEQRVDDIKGDINATFGWDMEGLEKKGLIKFLAIQPVFPNRAVTLDDINKIIKTYIYDILEKIKASITEVNAKRIAVDSISIIEMFIRDEYLSRVAMMQLVENLKKMKVTSLLSGTIPETSEALSGGGIVEFIVDTVIKLDFVPVAEEFKRTLTIRKMRRTDHSTMIHPFEIAKFGLKIIEIEG